MNEKLTSVHALPLNSECKIEYIYSSKENKIIPVLMITGIKSLNVTAGRIWSEVAEGHIGIVNVGYNQNTHETYTEIIGENNNEPIKVKPYIREGNEGDWLLITEEELENKTYELVYPRVMINSLSLKTDSTSLILKYRNKSNDSQNTLLEQYKDYSILTRPLQNQYLLTLNNDFILKNNYLLQKDHNNNIQILSLDELLHLHYIISNADVSIYLDALQIAEENARPKVSYNVKLEYINKDFVKSIPNLIGRITNINDADLKFKNVRGYVSAITLDLDNPDQDNIEIKNYKTKFEDLFSTITAQTEVMKKNSQVLQFANAAFTPTGSISQEVLQSSIQNVDLNYAFNNGKLTIDEQNGIWGMSETGVVAFRGGGIFTATEKNSDGNWKWNTGITPEGINADLITSGQLDTNLIKIYAGDHLRFQLNGDGMFAYKSKISDAQNNSHPEQEGILMPEDSADPKQYVVFNDNGLALIAKKGAKVLLNDKTNYFTVLNDEYVFTSKKRSELANLDSITRVEVSWDGFILRNWENERVFYADPQTGNLTIKGHIEATTGTIGAWQFNQNRLWSNSGTVDTEDAMTGEKNTIYNTYVALNSGGSEHEMIEARNINPITGITTYQTYEVDTTPYAFWAGHEVPDIAPLYIRKDGYLKAASGTIGGWNMNATRIYTSTMSMFSGTLATFSGETVYIPSNHPDASSSTTTTPKNSNAILWIHGYEKNSNNQKVTSYQADHSKFHINTDGEVMAHDYYLITKYSDNGKIVQFRSIADWLQKLESDIKYLFENAP